MNLLNRMTREVEHGDVIVTVSTLNTLQDAKYRAYLSGMKAWFLEETGVDLSTIDEWTEEALAGNVATINIGVMWAHNMAALTKVEEGGKQIPVPDEWKTPDGYLNSIPSAMFYEWNEAAELVNPGLWDSGDDDESKKNE